MTDIERQNFEAFLRDHLYDLEDYLLNMDVPAYRQYRQAARDWRGTTGKTIAEYRQEIIAGKSLGDDLRKARESWE